MRRRPLFASLASALFLHACGDATTSFAGDSGADAPDVAPDVAVVKDVPPPPMDVPPPPDVAEMDVPPPDVPAPVDVPAPRDTRPSLPDVPPVSGNVFDYVINTLLIDTSASETVAHTGFNLDGRTSSQVARERMPADCDHGDFVSSLDLDLNVGGCMFGAAGCHGGVDNQLPALADAAGLIFDLRAQLRAQVEGGQLTFLVRVSNVEGDLSPTLEDPEVVIRVYVGRSMIPASMCAGLFTPGARFAIDRVSLSNPSDINAARFAARGSIRAGRLFIGEPMAGADLSLSLPLFTLGGSTAALDLRGAQLRMDLTPDRAARGNLGGYVIAQDTIDSIAAIPAAAAYRSIITSLVRGLIDVELDGSCGLNGGVSMGMAFNAVRATIDPMAVDGPQSGNCGSF